MTHSHPCHEPDRLKIAVYQAIAAGGGNMRETIKELIVADEFLSAAVSPGYVRWRTVRPA